MKHAFGLLVALAVALAAGCSGDGLHAISGQVTLGGQPLENGAIDFLPADGKGPTAGAVVEAGRYAVRTAPGRKIVRIRGYRKVGQEPAVPGDPTSPMIDVNRQIVPERYNAKTELQCEVAAGQDTYDFALAGN